MTEANPYVSPTDDLVSERQLAVKPTLFSMLQRVGRIRYLAYSGVTLIAISAVMFFFGIFRTLAGLGEGLEALSVMSILVFLLFQGAMIFVSVILGIRRLHDLDKSGLFILLNLVPVVNIGMAIYMIFFPGSEGENSFGPKTAPNTVWTWLCGLILPLVMVLCLFYICLLHFTFITAQIIPFGIIKAIQYF